MATPRNMTPWCGQPDSRPTTRGSTFPASPASRDTSCTHVASRPHPASTCSATRGSTPEPRRCSAGCGTTRPSSPSGSRPAQMKARTQARLPAAVVLGASGSVITDALGPYEVFARSPEFFVYTVSARPTAMLSGALAVVPDYSLSDVDAGTAPEPAVIVIPAVVSPAGRKEQPLREWLARRAGRGAHLLGVCAGAQLLAAAGLLDGHRATTHWAKI